MRWLVPLLLFISLTPLVGCDVFVRPSRDVDVQIKEKKPAQKHRDGDVDVDVHVKKTRS